MLRLRVAIAMNARALKLPRPSLLIRCGKLLGPAERAGDIFHFGHVPLVERLVSDWGDHDPECGRKAPEGH